MGGAYPHCLPSASVAATVGFFRSGCHSMLRAAWRLAFQLLAVLVLPVFEAGSQVAGQPLAQGEEALPQGLALGEALRRHLAPVAFVDDLAEYRVQVGHTDRR